MSERKMNWGETLGCCRQHKTEPNVPVYVCIKCMWMCKFHSILHHIHISPDTGVQAIVLPVCWHKDMLLLHYPTQFHYTHTHACAVWQNLCCMMMSDYWYIPVWWRQKNPRDTEWGRRRRKKRRRGWRCRILGAIKRLGNEANEYTGGPITQTAARTH